MSKRNSSPAAKAVALQYNDANGAPVIVASGMGYMAEKIVETAQDSGVPIYEDNSLSTVLTQLKLGQEVPKELYQAIVEIYVYFLKFDPNNPDKKEIRREKTAGEDTQGGPEARNQEGNPPVEAAVPAGQET